MDPDQLAFEKPADQDPHNFQQRIYPGSAKQGLIIPSDFCDLHYREGELKFNGT